MITFGILAYCTQVTHILCTDLGDTLQWIAIKPRGHQLDMLVRYPSTGVCAFIAQKYGLIKKNVDKTNNIF